MGIAGRLIAALLLFGSCTCSPGRAWAQINKTENYRFYTLNVDTFTVSGSTVIFNVVYVKFPAGSVAGSSLGPGSTFYIQIGDTLQPATFYVNAGIIATSMALGTTTLLSPASGNAYDVKSDTAAFFRMWNYSNSLYPRILLARGRGKMSSPTALLAGDTMGTVEWFAVTGPTTSVVAARISAVMSTSTISTADGTINFQPYQRGVLDTTLTLAPRGLGINRGTPSANLNINGDVKISSGSPQGTGTNAFLFDQNSSTFTNNVFVTSNVFVRANVYVTSNVFVVGEGYFPNVILATTTEASTRAAADTAHGAQFFVVALDTTTLRTDLIANYIDISGSTHTKAGNLNIMGKVGIGKTNPTVTLDVNGPIYASNYISTANSLRAPFWLGESFYFRNSADTIRWMSLQTGGNIGIATSTPSGLLQVGGGTLTVKGSGYVGIGTTDPISKLETLDGDIRISTTTGNRGIYFQNGSFQTRAFQGAGASSTTIGTTSIPASELAISTVVVTLSGFGKVIGSISLQINSIDALTATDVTITVYRGGSQVGRSYTQHIDAGATDKEIIDFHWFEDQAQAGEQTYTLGVIGSSANDAEAVDPQITVFEY